MKYHSSTVRSLIRFIVTLLCWTILCASHAFEQQLSPRLILQPLIGGPFWLKLHVQVSLVDPNDDNTIRHKFDFVPLNATEPQTLLRLLTLQSVPGQIRTFQSTHSPSLQFCQDYNQQELHLIYNNCWTFAAQLYFYTLLQEREREE